MVIGAALLVLQVPLALPLAVTTFIGGFIPIVVATAAGALAVLVALVSNGPVPALILLAVAVVVVNQQEGNFLQPVLMGNALKVHGLVILLSLTAGTILAGIVGAVLAVPLAAVAWAVTKVWTGEEQGGSGVARYLLATAAFSFEPAVSSTEWPAAISIVSPVWGLRPVRAARSVRSTASQPGTVIFSPLDTDSTNTSNRPSRIRFTSVFAASALLATWSTSSERLMAISLSSYVVLTNGVWGEQPVRRTAGNAAFGGTRTPILRADKRRFVILERVGHSGCSMIDRARSGHGLVGLFAHEMFEEVATL